MKKLISLIVTVLLLVSLSVPAFAQGDSTEPQLIVSTEQAMPGDEAAVTITILNNPGIGVINPKFVFDATRLEWLGYEEGGLTGWTATSKAAVWLGYEDSYFDGVILTLKFKVLDSAPEGLAEVRLICGDGDAYNFAEQLILFQLVSGGVQVGAKQSPSPSPSPEQDQGSISARETIAPQAESVPQTSPAVASPSDAAASPEQNTEAPETAPAQEEDLTEASPVQDAASGNPAVPEEAAGETSEARSFPILPVSLAACVLVLLILFLIRKSQAGRKHK